MRIQRHYRRPARRGFTLVELLVAAAVSIVLMVILTEAFKRGIDMFRTLRAQGQLQERLRLATIGMRDDLASFHFDNPKNGSSNVNQNYLSDIDLRNDTGNRDINQPPELGFFRIVQFSPDWLGPNPNNNGVGGNPDGEPCVFEGTDGDGMLFSRATTHALVISVLRREKSPAVIAKNPVDPSYLFRTREPGALLLNTAAGPRTWPRDYIDPPDFRELDTFSSRWAEVAYFLRSNGRSANGTPLFNLHRRQKAILPEPDPSGPTGIPPGDVPYTSNIDISMRQEYRSPVPGANPERFYNRPSVGDGNTTRPGTNYPCNRLGMRPAVRMPSTNNNTNDPLCAGLLGNPTANYLSPALFNPLEPPQVPYPRTVDELTPGTPDYDLKGGDDIILSDVISFEIKVTWESPPQFIINPNPGPPLIPNPYYNDPSLGAGHYPAPRLTYNAPKLSGVNTVNTDYPFDYLPLSPINAVLATPAAAGQAMPALRVFDTWAGNDRVKDQFNIPVDMYARPRNGAQNGYQLTPAWKEADPNAPAIQTGARIPLRIRVRAIMIKLRIWDAKAEQTRQMTVIMDL